MNVTPALPSPNFPSAQPERKAVGAVRAVQQARPAGEEARRQQPPDSRIDPSEGEPPSAQLDQPHAAPLARRALSAYQQVAAANQRNGLRELLGFDAYA